MKKSKPLKIDEGGKTVSTRTKSRAAASNFYYASTTPTRADRHRRRDQRPMTGRVNCHASRDLSLAFDRAGDGNLHTLVWLKLYSADDGTFFCRLQ